MNKYHSNQLSMLVAVAALFVENAQKLIGFPIILTIKAELTDLINLIREKSKTVKTADAGKTPAKDVAKEILISLLYKMTHALYVYAKRNSLEDLKALCNVNRTEIKKMKEHDLITKAQIIIDKARENKTNLVNYSVTDEKIEALLLAFNNFSGSTDGKDTGIATRVAANTSLDQLFDDAMDLLEDELDGLMEEFRESDPDFFNAYINSRAIKDLGRHKSIGSKEGEEGGKSGTTEQSPSSPSTK
jgi:hypothetical protein